MSILPSYNLYFYNVRANSRQKAKTAISRIMNLYSYSPATESENGWEEFSGWRLFL
jgi:hypothetical protein